MTTTAETPLTRPAVPAWWQRGVLAGGAVLALLGAAWGSGAWGGTPIEEAADGALAADATLLAPATAAFAIWTPIYAGLAVFAVLQAVPRTGSSPRLLSVRWHVLAAMVLNAVWIATVQADALRVSVGVMAALVITLAWAVARLTRARPDTWIEAVGLDLPVGLYLGWATVAAVANVTALGAVELTAAPEDGTWAAVGALAAVLFIAIAMMRDLRPQPVLPWAVAAAMTWGVAWIAAGRFEGAPEDPAVAWAACAVAAAIPVAAWIADLSVALTRRRRRRGQLL